MDHRDIWEYKLNLTEEEVRRMFLHVWELKDIYSDYYFFDENCAYELLFLLESARPSLNLTDDFFMWVIPVDTIKIINRNDMVTSTSFRPSISTKIRHLLTTLDPWSQDISIKLASGELKADDVIANTQLDHEKKILSLDLATEIIQYNYSKGHVSKNQYKKNLIENLAARSSLGKSTKAAYEVTSPSQPETGHNSIRMSVGIGSMEKTDFSEIKLRPAYQTLSEPHEGFLEGSQIVFLDIAARYYEDIGLKLERIDVIDIFSLSPRNQFFKPRSWKVITGVKNKSFTKTDQHHVYYVNYGAGTAYKNDLLGLHYMMLETNVEASNHFDKGYAISIGASLGMIKNITPQWKISLLAGKDYYEAGDDHHASEIELIQNFKINNNSNLSLNLSKEKVFENTFDEVSLNLNVYF
jgi:hypothetical protein